MFFCGIMADHSSGKDQLSQQIFVFYFEYEGHCARCELAVAFAVEHQTASNRLCTPHCAIQNKCNSKGCTSSCNPSQHFSNSNPWISFRFEWISITTIPNQGRYKICEGLHRSRSISTKLSKHFKDLIIFLDWTTASFWSASGIAESASTLQVRSSETKGVIKHAIGPRVCVCVCV